MSTATQIRERRQTPLRTTDLEPAFPWRVHAYRPTIPPGEPDPPMTRYQLGASPVAWPTQCRDCWGWLDDPRHLTP